MTPICFYHKDDLDGVCSAAIVKHFVPDCELFGIDPDDEFPWGKVPFAGRDAYSEEQRNWTARRTVYLVNLVLPLETLGRLDDICDLVWFAPRNT